MGTLKLVLAVAVGLMLTACQGRVTEPSIASATIVPVAAGQARIYFYRDWEPYESLSRPLIYLNDTAAEISEPGGISFRDLAPGEYHISVDSQGVYPHQFKELALRAGDIRYVKVESLASWYTGRGPGHLGYRDTFVVELIPERQARDEITDKRYAPGGS
ncbi:MAG TPA: DUF2846 domain-containing protein [Stellaceae bacterium]|nr:DUF2846 domain-containing protein [Stellaceae bacterium]